MKPIYLMVLFSCTFCLSISCGRTEQETAAVTRLDHFSDQFHSLQDTDYFDLDLCENLLEFKIEINEELTLLSDIPDFNESLLDSIESEYESLIETNTSLLNQELQRIKEEISSDANAITEEIDLEGIIQLAESYIGFDINEDEPSSWRLRNIEVESTLTLSDSLANLNHTLFDLKDSLVEMKDFCSAESIPIDDLESRIDNVDYLSDTLRTTLNRLRTLANEAKHEIDLQRYNYLSSRVRITDDPAINMTFHKHINSPNHVNSRNYICYLYIGKSPRTIFGYLHFIVGYTRSNWVFVDRISFNIDGSIVNVPFDEYDNLDDVISGGQVSEWIDIEADEDLIERLIEADDVYVTFQGRNERYSKQLTQRDLTALAEMLEYHRLMPSCIND